MKAHKISAADVHIAIETEFRAAWEYAETQGWCDAIDGQEYERVFEEWLKHKLKENILGFIMLEANRPEEAKNEKV